MSNGRRRRRRVGPTEEWEQLELLCRWPEQLAYEEIRPLVLFGSPVADDPDGLSTASRSIQHPMCQRSPSDRTQGFCRRWRTHSQPALASRSDAYRRNS
jgi:hypothetical protein